MREYPQSSLPSSQHELLMLLDLQVELERSVPSVSLFRGWTDVLQHCIHTSIHAPSNFHCSICRESALLR